MDAATEVALASLGLQAVVAIGTVIWTAGRVARSLERKAEARQLEYEGKIAGQLDIVNSRIGEVGASLRTKITEVEFYVRDNYVSNATLR